MDNTTVAERMKVLIPNGLFVPGLGFICAEDAMPRGWGKVLAQGYNVTTVSKGILLITEIV